MNRYTRASTLHCPRDASVLHMVSAGTGRSFDCPRCAGRFLDQGEMYGALGAHADPSFWDRPECAAVVAESGIVCPRCRGAMLLTVLRTGSVGPYRGHGEQVEIDRCTRCKGIWLDHGEAERVLLIGQLMIATIEAERARAEDELARMSEPDFHAIESPLGVLASFLARFTGGVKS